MEAAEVTINEKEKTVTIVLPLQKPAESKSGKNMVIATTRGNYKSSAKYNGEEVSVGVNVYYKPDLSKVGGSSSKGSSKKKTRREEEEEDDD